MWIQSPCARSYSSSPPSFAKILNKVQRIAGHYEPPNDDRRRSCRPGVSIKDFTTESVFLVVFFRKCYSKYNTIMPGRENCCAADRTAETWGIRAFSPSIILLSEALQGSWERSGTDMKTVLRVKIQTRRKKEQQEEQQAMRPGEPQAIRPNEPQAIRPVVLLAADKDRSQTRQRTTPPSASRTS